MTSDCKISDQASLQAPKFESCFRLRHTRLPEALDDMKESHTISRDGAYCSLELFQCNMGSTILEELARKACALVKMSRTERILLHITDQKVCSLDMETEFRKFRRMTHRVVSVKWAKLHGSKVFRQEKIHRLHAITAV